MIFINKYYYFKSVLEDDFCEKIINIGLKKLSSSSIKATIKKDINNTKKKNITKIKLKDKTLEKIKKEKIDIEKVNFRDSEICFLNEDWIYKKVIPYVNHANKNAGWNFEYSVVEAAQFTKYAKNQYYGWHIDGQGDVYGAYQDNINNKKLRGLVRKLSVTINLSGDENYDGGNLKFDFGPNTQGERFIECTEIRPKGSIIVFPSFTYHQVTPVTKGTRYSLVMWICGKPFS